ncbi:glycoside hydrolase family 3 C-terminal domain-containing protein [Polaribacter sp. Q13]|uniref:glycoside hydrolase family 3 C-terminal domain-containing protein n=1 Tax=Polaribacter sp. Q13 TaxID=2806551 RepID=UPI00193B1225|nr:glycoside hydrolase family 3 C-terminal domain-containing protein [Polaribacter sp. Q13]QVY65980.1 glycoside hydrolase family 3 C-terminal domain-containing protein [Polaribacter sp. Q13]
MKQKIQLLVTALIICTSAFSQEVGFLFKDKSKNVEERVTDLMQRMTLEEKIDFTSGMRLKGHGPGQYDGTKINNRLGIPAFKIYHGPTGVNAVRYIKKAGTYYSTPINMACTWNPELVEETLNSMSKELNAAGGQSNAGPGMNIIRDLRCGRSFEYFTEDPFLNGQIAKAYVKGVQSEGNIAILKHFICNNQERERNYIDVKVGERALREIYLPGFKTAVKEGGALGIMTGYNYVNGFKSSENKHLINDILKKEWGFKGVVMTDWSGSGKSFKRMIDAGLDLEMPRPEKYIVADVLKAIKDGEISEEQINEQVRRILRVMFISGVFDKTPEYQLDLIATDENIELARRVAEESMVLLKNKDDLLPINRNEVKNIAVIGPNGEYGNHFREGQKSYHLLQGGGSAHVEAPYKKTSTPFAGVKNKAGSNINVSYEPGCLAEHGFSIIKSDFFKTKNNKPGLNAEYFGNNNLEGKATNKIDPEISFIWHKIPDIIEQGNKYQSGSKKGFSVRWKGKIIAPKSRNYSFEVKAFGKAKVFIDGVEIINKYRDSGNWDRYAVGNTYLEAGAHNIRVEFRKFSPSNQCILLWDYDNDEYLKRAIELAKKSDVVIMPVGTSGKLESESKDRNEKLNQTESLSLSRAQENLIREVAKVNKNVVVVTYTSGVVCEQWKDEVKAIIYAGFPGQEAGNALGNIIFGDVNPSGKLTVSIPKSISQYPDDFYSYDDKITYNEGIYVGYRYFDKHRLSPSFSFGHGLSYTQFEYNNLKVSQLARVGEVKIKVAITNIGKVKGKEVVQLYVNDPVCSVDRPQKELKGFNKVELEPGETKELEFLLDKDDFSFFREKENRWVFEPGAFNVLIGSSSKDIRKTERFIINKL